MHLAFTVGPDRLARLLVPADQGRLVLEMAGRAQQLLSCGVTTVRDLGDRGGLTVALREAINAGELIGPRILSATAPLTRRVGTAGSSVVRSMVQTRSASTRVSTPSSTAPG